MTIRGMLESATWPLRKLAWKIEEKLVWRVADIFRRGPSYRPAESEYIPAATDLTIPEPAVTKAAAPVANLPAADAKARRIPVPRLRAPSRDLSIALATIAVAVGGGIGIATLLGKEDTSSTLPPASGNPAAAQAEPRGDAPAAAQATTLQGASPEFEAAERTRDGAAATTQAQASPTQDTNAKPSAIPPGVASNISAMNTARDFAGAFVLYEVGESNARVRKAFRQTATPSLAKALADRPPRLPESVKVPTAKVQNVVLGTETGRTMEASVALLRLGDLSELRLTLSRRAGTWRVSEVRG